MLRILALFILSLVSAYGIAQTTTFDVKDLVNTQYTLGGDDDHVLAVTFQRDAGAPVVVSWQTNDPKDVLRSHSYTTAGTQAGRRVHIDLTTKPSAADAGVLWLSTKTFEEITKGKTMLELNKDEKATAFVTTAGKHPYTVYKNGKELTFNTIHLKSVGTEKGKEQELWVVDNANNPIIVKANGVYSYDMTDVMVDAESK